MHFDDRLATVLRHRAAGERAAKTQFRQLLDLLGERPQGGGDSALKAAAYLRLIALADMIPTAERAAIVGENGWRFRNPELVRWFGEAHPAIAAAAARRSHGRRMGRDHSHAADPDARLPAASPRSAVGCRARADRLGVSDRALPMPIPWLRKSPQHRPRKPRGRRHRRWHAWSRALRFKSGRRRRRTPRRPRPKRPSPPGPSNPKGRRSPPNLPSLSVLSIPCLLPPRRIPTSPTGFARWSNGSKPFARRVRRAPPRAMRRPCQWPSSSSRLPANRSIPSISALIPRAGSTGPNPRLPRWWSGSTCRSTAPMRRWAAISPPVRQSPAAAHADPLRGAEAIEGDWIVDAAPRFTRGDGRFHGYVGRFRRAIAAVDDRAQRGADRLRQLLHELRTPVNAMQGYAEVIQQQVFGPTPHEYRALAASIAGDSARILAGFDELDRLARLETGALDLEAGESDFAAIVRAQVDQLQASSARACPASKPTLPPIPHHWRLPARKPRCSAGAGNNGRRNRCGRTCRAGDGAGWRTGRAADRLPPSWPRPRIPLPMSAQAAARRARAYSAPVSRSASPAPKRAPRAANWRARAMRWSSACS